MLFNRPAASNDYRPHQCKYDDIQHEALEAYQRKYKKEKYTQKDPSVFITGATAAEQWRRWGSMDTQCNSQTQQQ